MLYMLGDLPEAFVYRFQPTRLSMLNGVNYCFLTDDGSKCTDEMLIRMATEFIDAINF